MALSPKFYNALPLKSDYDLVDAIARLSTAHKGRVPEHARQIKMMVAEYKAEQARRKES